MPISFTTRTPTSKAAPAVARGRRLQAVGAAAAVLAAGIWWLRLGGDEPPKADATCVYVFDTDAGTAPIHTQYPQWIDATIDGCTAHLARVYGLPATASTETDRHVVTVELAKTDGLGGNARRDRQHLADRVDGLVDEMTDMVKASAADPGHTGTDLLAIGPTVEDLLADHDQELRQLVVFSDGLNTRTPYNLTVVPLDDDGIEAIIGRLRSDGLLPDLSGVVVRWYGRGMSPDAAQLSPERLAAIERFWRRYFEATGADLEAFTRTP